MKGPAPSRCSLCGKSSVNNELRSLPYSEQVLVFQQSMACFDAYSCTRRRLMQTEADDWYAEEVKRMAERAPA